MNHVALAGLLNRAAHFCEHPALAEIQTAQPYPVLAEQLREAANDVLAERAWDCDLQACLAILERIYVHSRRRMSMADQLKPDDLLRDIETMARMTVDKIVGAPA